MPEQLREFREGLAPLGAAGKLGALLLQFPAGFHCDDGTRDRLRRLLAEFADYRVAVELRHRSWEDGRDILDEARSVPVFIDEPKFRDSIRQQLRVQQGLVYVRFHGRNAATWWRHAHRNERYDYLYSVEELAPHVKVLREAVTAEPIQRAYIFFNNHPSAKAVVNAVMLRRELGLPARDALPETLTARYPEAASGSL